MSSTTWLYDLRHTLRRRAWFSTLLCVVAFLFSMPIPAAISLQNAAAEWSHYATEPIARQVMANSINEFFRASYLGAALALILGAVLAGLLFFSYIHSRQRVDFFHSLPLSRGGLFAIHYLSGALSVLLPYLVNLLLTVAVVVCLGLGPALHLPTILLGLGQSLLFFFAVYSLVVLAAMLTGHFVVHTMMSAYLLLVGPASVLFYMVLGKMFFPTWYVVQSTWMRAAVCSSPFTRWLGQCLSPLDFPFTLRTLLLLLLLILAAVLLALILYRKRPSEVAGKALAFPWVRPLVKYPVTLLVMAGIGAIFYEIGEEKLVWYLLGAAISGLICTQGLEMLYRFDFSGVKRKLLPGLLFVALFCGLSVCGFLDLPGFNSYLPAADQVAKVELQLSCNQGSVGSMTMPLSYGRSPIYSGLPRYGVTAGGGDTIRGQKLYLREKAALSPWTKDPLAFYPLTTEAGKAAALDLAKAWVQGREEGTPEYFLTFEADDGYGNWQPGSTNDYGLRTYSGVIRYTLTNGRTVTREYTNHIYIRDTEAQLAAIYDAPGYRETQYTLFRQAPERVLIQEVDAFSDTYFNLYEWQQKEQDFRTEETARLLAAMEEDMAALDFRTLRSTSPIGMIVANAYAVPVQELAESADRVSLRYTYPIYPAMTKTLAALEAFDIDPQAFQPTYDEAISLSVIPLGKNIRYDVPYDQLPVVEIDAGTYYPTPTEPKATQARPEAEGDLTFTTTDPAEIREWIDRSVCTNYWGGESLMDFDPGREVMVTYKDRYGEERTEYRALPHPPRQ